jgi:hypothetical protein
MVRDDSKVRLNLQMLLLAQDGVKPSGALEWVSAVAPVATQAAVGAGHWASGRRQRAPAAWACAAGSGLAVYGLATEAPTRAEMQKNAKQYRDRLRELGARVGPDEPAAEGTQTQARQPSLIALTAIASSAQVFFGVRSGLRHPQRLTARAIATEAFSAGTFVLSAVRAAQQSRPRIAAGRALVAAGSLARLRAVSAEPLV